MPYARNAELPPAVRDAYNDRCQTVFRKVWNNAMNPSAGGGSADESGAFRIAHTAAKNCMQATKDERSPLVDMTVKFAEGSDTIIEGLGVPFGIDLDGERFTSKSNRCADWFPNGGRPILYHHGLDSTIKMESVGRELSTEPTEEGDWVRGELNKASKFYKRVAQLVRDGKVGWSSGAPDHKVKIAKDGHIDLWPVVEYSLTPTPAFPNKVTYAMKSADVLEHLEAADVEIPEPLAAAVIEQTHEGDSEPEPLADHSQRVLAEVKAWVERVSEKSDFRAKSGRELSKTNVESLRQAHRIIGELLSRNDTEAQSEEDASKAFADWLKLEAELAGVPA